MDSGLSLHLVFLIVFSCVRCTIGACRGEPKNVESDRAPDLNITLSTGLVARVGDELIITCIADKPRYQFLSSAPYPPTLVTAIFNRTLKTKRCDPNKGPTRCVQTLSVKLTKAGKNVAVLCHTKNDVDCRLKNILLTILERRTQKPNSTSSSLMPESSQVMSTSMDQLMPSASLTVDVSLTKPCVIPSQSSGHVQPTQSVVNSSAGVQLHPVVSMIKSSFEAISPSFTSTNHRAQTRESTPPFLMMKSSLEMKSSCLSYSVTPSCTVVTPTVSFSINITNCTDESEKLKKRLKGKTMAEVIEHFQGKKKKVDNDKKKPDGKKTVGIGFNMQQPDARKIWQKVLPCVPFDDVLSGKRCLEEAEIQKLFQHTLKEKIKIAKRLFPKYDTYPDDVKTALVNGVFHGDFEKGHKTVKLINEGKWDKVANEYLDRKDYKNCERNGLRGIKKRLDWNADIFRKYAEKSKKKP